MRRGVRAGGARQTRRGVARALLCAVLTLPLAAPGQAGEDSAPRNLTGVWWGKTYSAAVNPGVTAIVFTPDGKAAYERNKAALANGSLTDRARKTCAPDGVPRVMASPYPFEIALPAYDGLLLRFEVNGSTRSIIMNRAMPPAAELTPEDMGHSFGRWDGSTLIVESAGFADGTFLDATGLPHSRDLRVTEYFWKSDDGRRLNYVALVTDPKMFSQVWAERFSYERRPDIRIANYACGGANRNLSQVAGAEQWK
jgi:hypothetical protein